MVDGEGTARESRVQGGYRLISVSQLCRVWAAYRVKRIGYRDLRVWFAAHEMSSRRCQLKKGRLPRYTLAELQILLDGAGTQSLRASLRNLEKAGCLCWSESSLTFPSAPDDASESSEFHRMMGLIINNRRKVPVPRRILRHIARSSRPAMVATVLGFLLRCLYQKDGQSHPEGCCKASWVGAVFGVDPRNVRRAKQNLVALGWLCPKDSDHWHRQRWGGKALINLAWSEPPRRQSATKQLPYRRPDFTPQLPYPESNKKLLSESKNTKPGAPVPIGASAKRERGGTTPGRLSPVTRDDLADSQRLQSLWVQASHSKLIGRSSAERLNFFAAAQRALRLANRNPPGFFVAVLRKKLWHVISQVDEERASAALRELDAAPVATAPFSAPPTPPERQAPSAVRNPTTANDNAEIRRLIMQSMASVAFDRKRATGKRSEQSPSTQTGG